MNRRSLGGGLVSMAAVAWLLAAQGVAAAGSGPHRTASSIMHARPSTHRSGGARSVLPARRSVSGHVSPYARSRDGLVDPGNVESIRSYYQREANRPVSEDGRPATPPPGAPP